MRPLLPLLLLSLLSTASADPNAPLMFQLRPLQFHVYRSDPPTPLTLTLHLQNPAARPVTLRCLSLGAPILKRWTQFQDGQAVNAGETLGQFQPVGDAPTCARVGQVLTLPAGAKYTYTRALGPQKVGAQVSYSAGWNVSLRPGFSWLSRAYASALVVNADRPVATPTPQKYQDALEASGAMWYTRSSRESALDSRLSFTLADELSRQALLAEFKKRGLDASNIDLEVAPPVRFPSPPALAHTARVTVQRSGESYIFTLKVTNKSSKTINAQASGCDPAAIERVPDGTRVRQTGNGPCAQGAMPPTPLAPGKSVTYTLKWHGRHSLRRPVAPGSYRVRLVRGQFVGETVFMVK